jgi:cell division protein FtsL
MAGAGRRPLLALGLAILWFGALASASGVIYLKHRSRSLFVELERANARRDNLEIEWGQLQLEQSAWSTHAFVERIANSTLRMGMPPPQSIQIMVAPGVAAGAAP